MACRLIPVFLFTVLALTAAIVPRMALEDLVEESELIVEGRIVESRVAWDASHKRIWTHFRIAVADSLKSTSPQTVEVSVPGGVLDGVGMDVPGAITLQEGEEVLLFLYRTPVGYMRATGYGQGKYSIVTDPATGARRLRSSVRGMTLVDPVGKPPQDRRRTTSLESADGSSLDGFKSLIRQIVREGQ